LQTQNFIQKDLELEELQRRLQSLESMPAESLASETV